MATAVLNYTETGTGRKTSIRVNGNTMALCEAMLTWRAGITSGTAVKATRSEDIPTIPTMAGGAFSDAVITVKNTVTGQTSNHKLENVAIASAVHATVPEILSQAFIDAYAAQLTALTGQAHTAISGSWAA
jgi:hypothetical protein